MEPIRLVVSDLDGTLLSPDHTLPGSVVTAIRKYVREGGLFTIATGRPLLTARSVIEQIGIELPVILCNGAVMAQGGRILEQYLLQAERLADALLDAHCCGVTVLLFRGSEIEAFARSEDVASYERKEKVRCSLVSPMDEGWRSGGLEKVILLGDIRLLQSVWERWRPTLEPSVTAFQSEPNYVELVSADASKGIALKRLAAMLGVPEQATLAVGNQMNDLSMLQAAGIGAAVGNSPPELKAAADYVCAASYGAGVMEAIEQYIYGGEQRWTFEA